MKKIIFTFCLFIVCFVSRGQTIMVSEDFEIVDSAVNIASSGPGWADDQTLFVSGSHSYHAAITSINDTNILELTGFDPFVNQYFTLNFKHIAKVDFFDRCIIEVSNDFGASWIQVTTGYNGTAATWASTNSFMAPAYPNWVPGSPTQIPDNTWWQSESFDLSMYCAFALDVRIRFKMFDNNNNGGASNYGWNLDDINVVGALCELIPPVMSQAGTLAGAVYSAGPFNVSYTATDQSGISYGYLVYTITDSLGNVTGPDSIALTNPSGNTWTGTFPVLNIGDTVCYYAYTVDASGCNNYMYVPSNGCTSFYYGTAVGFPYCNDFDIVDTTWTVVTPSGSPWQWGLPTTPPTNSTFSGAGCWDVELNSIYLNNTETYLYSPLFQWNNNINVKLSFWQNFDMESGWDGTVLFADTGGTGNWFQIGILNDPNGTNWYNSSNINSNPGIPAWDGNSNGWMNSEIILYQLNGYTGQVQFRFQFTSDGSVVLTGHSIDRFCLKLPQPNDAGVVTILEPQNEAPVGSNQAVKVRIKNYGTSTLAAGGFDVAYNINGVLTGSAPYAGNPIAPNATDTFTIPVTFAVPSGAYDICAYTSWAADGDHTNDTICNSFLGIPTFTVPYCDNFDTGTVFWNGMASSTGVTAWQLGPPNFGVINSAKSTPNAWVTNLTSNYDNNADCELRSPYFDLSSPSANNSTISFWMNRNIELGSDGMILEYTVNNGATWQSLGAGNPALGTNWYNNNFAGPNFNGPGWDGNSGGWVRCDYPLAILNGTPSVRFRFHFESDFFGVAEGAGIDDFCVKPPVPNDAGVKRIIAPGSQVVAGATVVPTVVIKNYGNNTLSSIPVSYSVNGVLAGSGIWSGSLNPNDSVQFNTWPGFSAPSCNFNFSAYTELPADGDILNDTSFASVVGVPLVVLPVSGAVCENFDSVSCWTAIASAQGTSKWELGTPNFGITNTAYSAPNAWDINLNTAYDNNAETYLYTAKYDFTNAVNATMSFWHNWSTESGWDGVRVEVDSGNGVWQVLGTGPTDPQGVNWYNKATIISSNLPAWDGQSSGAFGVPLWIKSSHNLDFLSGHTNVQFRFIFTSDGSVTGDGHSIDDFCIRTPFPHDIGVSAIIRPGPLEGAGQSLAPQVIIKNYGSNPETTSPVVYSVNAGAPVSFTWNGNLAPNQTDTVTLPVFTVPSANFLFCAWTELVGDGDLTNDSLCANSFGVQVVVPTYATNFDTGAATFVNVPASGATNWELGTPNFGQTNTPHSAPSCWDVNLNITYANNDSCYLYTPIFDLTNKKAPVFRFWHNRNLDNFNGDGVRVDYTVNGGTTWKVLGSAGLSFPQALNWYNSANIFQMQTAGWNGSSAGWIFSYIALDTNVFNGAPGSQAQFRFVFVSNGFTQVDGYSVDDFELFIPTALSISPQNIAPVNKLITPGPQYITAKIRNKGTQTVNTGNATLVVDGNIVVTDAITFTPGLQGASYVVQGGANIHTFSVPWNASPGLHTICVYTDTPNGLADQDMTDDTLCMDFTVFDSVSIASGIPYCNDFESPPQWVTLNAMTFQTPNNWELGTPTKACLNSTHSGTNAWATKLGLNYPNRDTSALFSPVFNIDATKCYKLSFWHKYDTEQFQDGGDVEYSVDSGNTWSLLGFGGEPNWYNSLFITGLGGNPPRSGFSGTNCTWTQAVHQYEPWWTTTTVIFRFRFGSDFSFNKEGWVIDDVCFEELSTPCTVGVPEANEPAGLELGQNYPNPANASTNVDISLPASGNVTFEISDLMGQVIMTPLDGNMGSGRHTLNMNTQSLAPGIYFYTLTFNKQKLVKKMVIAE